MKLSAQEKQGIIDVLTRIYEEIRGLELTHNLLFGGGDFRPRIDYFHDAVRAFSAGRPEDYAPGGRLCIEMLAYDVSALRYLASHPLSPVSRAGQPGAAGGELIDPKPGALSSGKPPRETKDKLSELYQHYGVLFAALLKPQADRDFKERTDRLNEMVEQAYAQGQQAAAQSADREIKAVDKAHLEYSSAQLGLYEEGKDIVKQLAAKGLNLAGRFVQNSMDQARRDTGPTR